MIQPIHLFGHPILRKKARQITNGRETVEVIQDLVETLNSVGGAALSAPQIGHDVAIIIIGHASERRIFINPEILETEGPMVAVPEGCLSIPIPDLPMIKRPTYVQVKFLNENMVEETHVYDGILSRILQHEIDHLNGKLSFDMAPREWKLKHKKVLRGLEQSLLAPGYLSLTADGKEHTAPPQELAVSEQAYDPAPQSEEEKSADQILYEAIMSGVKL